MNSSGAPPGAAVAAAAVRRAGPGAAELVAEPFGGSHVVPKDRGGSRRRNGRKENRGALLVGAVDILLLVMILGN